MAKSLLNNLLGRFGIKLDKAKTILVKNATFKQISLLHKVVSYKTIGENSTLVSYLPKLDPTIIKSHNLDIVKIASKYKDDDGEKLQVTSVPISAAVTSYARIYISKIKLKIMANGGKIFYSDTDSIVTSQKLPESLVNDKELGKFKLEHVIKKGIFISGKTYCLLTDKDIFINRAKGVKSNSLNYNDYVNLLNSCNVNTAVKSQSKID